MENCSDKLVVLSKKKRKMFLFSMIFHKYKRRVREIRRCLEVILYEEYDKLKLSVLPPRTGRDIIPYCEKIYAITKPTTSILSRFLLGWEVVIDGWSGLCTKKTKRQEFLFDDILATKLYSIELAVEFKYCSSELLYDMWEPHEVRARDTEFEPEEEFTEEFEYAMHARDTYANEHCRREVAEVIDQIKRGLSDQEATRWFIASYFAALFIILVPIFLCLVHPHHLILFLTVGAFFKLFISLL